jgi:hypothetical protein
MTRYLQMPQLYLHIYNDHGDAEDDEGLEVPSLPIAREKAVHGIRSLLAAEVENGSFNLDGRIDIKDGRGEVLLTRSRKRSTSRAPNGLVPGAPQFLNPWR